jgi:hypothetical protein
MQAGLMNSKFLINLRILTGENMLRVTWKRLALVGAGMVLWAGSLQAQGWYIMGAVGNSSQFNVWGAAAYFGMTAPAQLWSGKNMGGILDPRTGVPLQKGNLWVAWSPTDNKTAFYLSVESTPAVRAMYASPRCTLWLDPNIANRTSDNLIGGLGIGVVESSRLPLLAINAIRNQPFTVGFSELRPEDAKAATARAFTSYGGADGIGNLIQSSISGRAARAIDFNISGEDPISQEPVPSYQTVTVGANVIVVFINDQNLARGHLGARIEYTTVPVFTDVTSTHLAGFFDGSWSFTRNLNMDANLPDVPTTVFLFDPLSGAYNTFEYSIPAALGIGSSQETGRLTEPFLELSNGGGFRRRVIGVGEMTGTRGVGGVYDSIGYAFWGWENFKTARATCRYLTVDGYEPLQNNYNFGFFPSATGDVTFKAMRNGQYPIWGLHYAILANPNDPFFVLLNQVADYVLTTYPEYASWSSMKVFKSHTNPDPALFPNMAPHNGIAPGAPAEWGGTVGGRTYWKKTEQDYVTATGQELVNRRQ